MDLLGNDEEDETMVRWLLLFVMVASASSAWCGDVTWNQFRGPNAGGLATDDKPLPAEISPESNVVWKASLPPGHSSPVLDKNNVYVTASEEGKLLTIAVSRADGKEVWRAEAPLRGETEEIHRIGSLAQPSPATDGEVVVSFFGSSGLSAYKTDGSLLWEIPMGPFKNNFGAGSSPILCEDWVILCQDHDTDSFLAAIDKWTGKFVWRTDRSEFPRSYATPVIWDTPEGRQIVVAGTLRVVGYDFRTGRELWTVRGISRIVNMTPIAAPNGMLYIPAWSPGGDEGDRIVVEPFEVIIEKEDKNADGVLSLDETPDGPLKQRFGQIDRDKDKRITREEFEGMRRVFEDAQNVMLAIKPGGSGDITDTHVVWKQTHQLPYVPTPVFADGTIYMVKNGGIFSSVDATTGEIVKSGRMAGRANYYASPVVGDGKIYVADQEGIVTVVSAEPEWKVLHRSDFGAPIFGTPAISDGRIYVRTSDTLYCLGLE